jgi:hypothetical protein
MQHHAAADFTGIVEMRAEPGALGKVLEPYADRITGAQSEMLTPAESLVCRSPERRS